MPSPWARGARLRIVGSIHGQETINVMHFATNTVVNDGTQLDQILLQLATAMLECVVEFLLPAVSQDWSVTRVDAQAIYPTLGDPVVATPTPPNVGELGVTSVSFAASLVNVRTGIGGRRGRGRIFLPPAGEAQIQSSELDGPTLTLIVAFLACVASKFTAPDGTTPWELGVLSRTDLNGVLGNFDNSFRLATQLTPSKFVAKIGSRKVGRGA